MDSAPKSANELAADRTDLAVERTIMAAGRSQMAWVRTGLSLISFGFTMYKFLQAAAKGAELGMMRAGGPRRLGLLLIALGTLSVVLGAVEYHGTVRKLNKISVHQYRAFNFYVFMGLMIGLLGLFLFVTIFFHKEVF